MHTCLCARMHAHTHARKHTHRLVHTQMHKLSFECLVMCTNCFKTSLTYLMLTLCLKTPVGLNSRARMYTCLHSHIYTVKSLLSYTRPAPPPASTYTLRACTHARMHTHTQLHPGIPQHTRMLAHLPLLRAWPRLAVQSLQKQAHRPVIRRCLTQGRFSCMHICRTRAKIVVWSKIVLCHKRGRGSTNFVVEHAPWLGLHRGLPAHVEAMQPAEGHVSTPVVDAHGHVHHRYQCKTSEKKQISESSVVHTLRTALMSSLYVCKHM